MRVQLTVVVALRRHALSVSDMNATFVQGLPSKVHLDSVIESVHTGWMPRQPGAHGPTSTAEAHLKLAPASPSEAKEVQERATMLDALDADRSAAGVDTAVLEGGVIRNQREFFGGEYAQVLVHHVFLCVYMLMEVTYDTCRYLRNIAGPDCAERNRERIGQCTMDLQLLNRTRPTAPPGVSANAPSSSMPARQWYQITPTTISRTTLTPTLCVCAWMSRPDIRLFDCPTRTPTLCRRRHGHYPWAQSMKGTSCTGRATSHGRALTPSVPSSTVGGPHCQASSFPQAICTIWRACLVSCHASRLCNLREPLSERIKALCGQAKS